MNTESVIQSEISQREKQISYIIAYIWSLEKVLMNLFLQGRDGDADIENRLWTKRGKKRMRQIQH